MKYNCQLFVVIILVFQVAGSAAYFFNPFNVKSISNAMTTVLLGDQLKNNLILNEINKLKNIVGKDALMKH